VSETRIAPRIEIENPVAGRLIPEALPAVATAPSPGMGTLGLIGAGLGVLVAGLSALSIGNFIADEFARAPWLGWISSAVAATGAGLIATAAWRELRFIHKLDAVDQLRADLADPDRAKDAAKTWLRTLPHSADLAPALDAVNDPDAILALLRAGPAKIIAEQAQALGRAAAMQMAAITAAVPSPALDGAIVTLRGIRLVRQVAGLYGFRPSTFGTIALVRRTLLSGVYVTSANLVVDMMMKAVTSNAHVQTLAGDVAGTGTAARRMIVLARATAAACSPVSPEA